MLDRSCDHCHKRQYPCPVCGGAGTVPLGLYGKVTVASVTGVEKCRSCHGAGVL